MNKKAIVTFSWTGFVLALILISMFATVFGLFITQMNEEYGTDGNNSFAKYENYTKALQDNVNKTIKATDIEQDEGILDVIGGFFSSGYAALKTAISSFNIFGLMMDDMTDDVEELSIFKTYIWMFIAMSLFIGVVVAVLVKMRI